MSVPNVLVGDGDDPKLLKKGKTTMTKKKLKRQGCARVSSESCGEELLSKDNTHGGTIIE